MMSGNARAVRASADFLRFENRQPMTRDWQSSQCESSIGISFTVTSTECANLHEPLQQVFVDSFASVHSLRDATRPSRHDFYVTPLANYILPKTHLDHPDIYYTPFGLDRNL